MDKPPFRSSEQESAGPGSLGAHIGSVESVQGSVVDVRCTHPPLLRHALRTATGAATIQLEVQQELDPHRVRTLALGRTGGMRRGQPVFDTQAPVCLPVSPSVLGRLLDVFGNPLDGGAPVAAEQLLPLTGAPLSLNDSKPLSGILENGQHETVTASVSDVAAWLLTHNVTAKPVVEPVHEGVSQQIRAIASNECADLVVAGAYGHSRFQEWVLGGVTRHLLRDTESCGLMSH